MGHPAARSDRATLGAVVGVVSVSTVLGVSLAWLVSAYRFPGRRVLSWVLVLPLAMPGYILGFVTTSVFGVAGPVQTWWRDQFGTRCLVPRDPVDAVRDPHALAHALSLRVPHGAGRPPGPGGDRPVRRPHARRIACRGDPPGRAAVAAAGDRRRGGGGGDGDAHRLRHRPVLQGRDRHGRVFRIWRGTYDRDAASEIASLVLLFALLAIGFERLLRGRARFGESGGQSAASSHGGSPASRVPAATAATGVRGHARLRRSRAAAAHVGDRRAAQPTWHADGRRLRRVPGQQPVLLALTTIVACVVVAALITNARRFGNPRSIGWANRLSAAGYAVPGPVVAMGVVRRARRPRRPARAIGLGLPGAVATGSFLALAYAYVDPLPGPGDRLRRGRARAGSRRDDGIGALARSVAHQGARPDPPAARRGPAC